MKKKQLDAVLTKLQELHEEEMIYPFQFLTLEEMERKELLSDDEKNWYDELMEG